MKTLFALLVMALLSGCANLANNINTVATRLDAMQAQYGEMPPIDDSWMAHWAYAAKSSFQMRTQRLYPSSSLVKGLKSACARGLLVQVMLPLTQRASAKAVQGTCVQVYVSDYPDMVHTRDVALVDQDTLIVEGHLNAVGNHRVRQEYLNQQYVKATAQRLQ